MKKYSLVGVDGNAFCLMGYTRDAMEDARRTLRKTMPEYAEAQYGEEAIDKVMEEAMSSNYDHLVGVLNKKIQQINHDLKVHEDEDGILYDE